MSKISESLESRLRALLERNEDKYFPAPDRVTIEAVRRMTGICGDRNPVYRDPVIAKQSGHTDVVAPPSSVFASWLTLFDEANTSDWVDANGFHRFRIEALPSKNRSMRNPTMEEVGQVLASGGITSLAATGGEITLSRYPRVGERLYYTTTKVESVSALKQTVLGEGYFITYCASVRDQVGEPVAELRITTYNFAPTNAGAMLDAAAEQAPGEVVRKLRPFAPPEKQLVVEEVRIAQELPSMIVEVTPSLIIAGALFHNEEMDIHHDRDLAQRRGFRDIFMNTTTTLGLVTRFVSDWAGPMGIVERIKWRLGRQQYPNDDLCFNGTVVSVESGEPRGRITLEVVGTNSLGTHATCQVQMNLPNSDGG